MPELPAYCDKCGAQKTHTGVIGEDSRFEGPAIAIGECECGGTFIIGDLAVQGGKITRLKQAYRILTRPDIPASDLRRLLRLLEDAKRNKAAPNAVVASIEEQTPQFADLKDVIVPQNPSAFWAMVAALIALIALIRSWKKPAADIPNTTLTQIIYNIEHKSYSAGRNDPCPCGSGKKFKHCHGRK